MRTANRPAQWGKRLSALLMLVVATACGEGVIDSTPGGGSPPPEEPVVVASVEVAPGALQFQVEHSRPLSATVRAQTGRVLPDRAVQWSSSDASIVRVDASGNATALRAGTAVVTAASEGKQGQATIEVLPPPAPPAVAFVTVSGGGVEIEPGEVRQLGVTLRAADGSVLDGRAVAWASSDTSVVRVRPDGSVLGLIGGTATITATSEGKTGTTTLTIPQWLRFDLQSLGGQALPAVGAMTADTTHRTESGFVVTERRVKVSVGRVWLSTVDWRYRQLYEVQTWERTVSNFQGNTIVTQETLVEQRTLRDEGRAEMFDMFTGEPIYESEVFAGHSFRVYRTENRGRMIHQALPGIASGSYDFRFAK